VKSINIERVGKSRPSINFQGHSIASVKEKWLAEPNFCLGAASSKICSVTARVEGERISEAIQ
jgi:hypothetical protein